MKRNLQTRSPSGWGQCFVDAHVYIVLKITTSWINQLSSLLIWRVLGSKLHICHVLELDVALMDNLVNNGLVAIATRVATYLKLCAQALSSNTRCTFSSFTHNGVC